MGLETTVEEREASAGSDVEPESSVADVFAQVEAETYGRYIACEVVDLEATGDGEVVASVDIPGYDDPWPWRIDVRPAGGDNHFERVLADHGLNLSEADKLVGKRVLLAPREGEDGVEGWQIYDPADPLGDVPAEWYAEHPFSPHEPSKPPEEAIEESVQMMQHGLMVSFAVVLGLISSGALLSGEGGAGLLMLLTGVALFAHGARQFPP